MAHTYWNDITLTFGRNIASLDRDITSYEVREFIYGTVVPNLTAVGQDAFSLTHHSGYWKGMHESSFTIRILCEGDTYEQVLDRCYDIGAEYCDRFNQDSVLLETRAVNPPTFITADDLTPAAN